MGWLVFILAILYFAYRAQSSASKARKYRPQSATSKPPAYRAQPSALKPQPIPDNFEKDANHLIADMRCSRCNTGQAPTYHNEIINCCCRPFLNEIIARIQSHFSAGDIACKMTYRGKESNSAALVSDKSQLPQKQAAEPEILITYVDGNGQETTRALSNLRYSNSYYFKAYCHLREEERSFCPERIKQAVDLRTGEILDTITVRWGDKGKTRKFTDVGWK